MQNPVDAFSEEMYQSIRKSILDAAKRGENPDIMLVEYFERLEVRAELRAFNRLSKDSNPKVAAFAAAIAGELRCFIKDLLDELTS